MRIQHNIMAMNAYRNYTNNVSAMKANLEKLSSGYKINRAGNDAAGLAISEKMRAQITGLETAQKNAKDGISLVQTAEGALTEVHDMLNRMVELATQSANGTYDDATDRYQLQKEMDQLRNEIDRIADSSNFNGIKLLDGSMATVTTPGDELGVGMKDMASAITHIADGVEADSPAVKTKFELDLSQVSVTNKGTALAATDITDATATTATVASANSTTAATTLTYAFDGAEIAAQAADGATVKMTIGDQEIEITVPEAGLDDTAIAAAVRDALTGKTITIGGVAFTAGGSAKNLVLTATTNQDDSAVFTAGTYAMQPTMTANKPVQETMQVEITLGDPAGTGATAPFKFSDKGVIEVEYGKTWTGKDIAAKLMENLGDTKEVDIGGTTFTVTNDNGKLTFEMKEDPTAKFDADLTADLKVLASDGTTELASASGTNTGKNDLGAVINQGEGIGVHIIQNAKAAETRHLAQGSLDLTQLNNGRGIEDGTALKIGNETYVFAVGKDSKYKDMQNVVDLTHVDPKDTTNWSAAEIAKEASRRLSAVAMGNTMFDVSTDNVNGTVRLTERLNSGIDYSVNNLQGPTADILNELTTDVAKKNAAWKNLVQAGTANLDAKPATTSGGLMLQIGDTADSYNQLRVSIDDCHVAALGLDGISISDQEGAAAAIDVIKDAINKVSDVRGTLGATQNRLDHTINNLSVMTENIQDAESTIRDVDVAEEMMAYTKNNILIQSAQAMLAQANQVPQGVLQLLQ